MNRITVFLIILFFLSHGSYAQKTKTDANIIGHVVCCGKHIAFANVAIKGTAIGATTDETGHYQLINLPTGKHTIIVSILGYKPQERAVEIEANKTIEINFELKEDILNLDEVVVSANRGEQKRTEASTIVNTISPKTFNISQSVTLGEGLNFSPGLRLENNCQNCGFSQVRMNGMEGAYSQILINSRPIFSGLAGVYGLELIPTNMIEKIEVIRGGSSALYGSNAIAGTINILIKDPTANTYQSGVNIALSGIGESEAGGISPDYLVNFNTSFVSANSKSGMALYGFTRKREMFDANNDSFSEIAPMKNLTLGTRLFQRFGYRDKLTIDFFAINEKRDGGNKQDYPQHERDIAEALTHNLKVGGITYERFFRNYDLFSVYVSGQFLNRDSYYGANQSLSSYGNTIDNTYNIGAQYKAIFGISSIIAGLENTGGFLMDKKLGYPEYDLVIDSIMAIHNENVILAEQSSVISGLFAQYELKLQKLKVSVGARYDHYSVSDLAEEGAGTKSGYVISPRISIMYKVFRELQARISYSQGYRAPQIFDEDLHIETSGSRQVVHENDPDLKQETSHSIMASLDFNGSFKNVFTGLLVEGFYIRLEDPFINEIGEMDENGTVIYTRKNAKDGATVQGINIEFKLKPLKILSLTSGFTMQLSKYDVAQEFNEKRFFRTPDNYGYLAFDWNLFGNFSLSTTGTYTGSMLVPYFGTEADPDTGELRETEIFFDLGIKLRYNIKINGTILQLSGGIKNIFNSYQSDFDVGIDRDPAYVYGPVSPRTIFFGIKFGNYMD